MMQLMGGKGALGDARREKPAVYICISNYVVMTRPLISLTRALSQPRFQPSRIMRNASGQRTDDIEKERSMPRE